jgi:predicted Na+-dependent transporter
MRSAIEWVGRYGTVLMPLGIIIGVAVQPLAHLLFPLLPFTVYLMLTIVLTRLDVERAIAHLRRPKVFIVSLIYGLLLVPLTMSLIATALPLSPGLQTALVVYGTAPPNYAAAALAFVMGLDGALTVATIFATTALHPVMTPLFVEAFTDGTIRLSAAELGLRLAGLIGAAVVSAFLLNKWMGPQRRKAASTLFDGLNVLIMVVFAIALMAGIPDRVIAQPLYALGLAALATGLHVGLNLITVALFLVTGRERAMTLGYAHAGRNIAVVMGVLGSAAPPDAWLFFAMLQFPIYCLPMLLKPLYRKLLRSPELT